MNPRQYGSRFLDVLAATARSKTQLARPIGLSSSALSTWRELRLRKLLSFAVAYSPFYAERFRGLPLDRIPLADLPILTKSEMMQNFDTLVTDRRLSLASLQTDLDHLTHDRYSPGGVKAFRSGGSTGSPTVMVYNRTEWQIVMAQILRNARGLVPFPIGTRLRAANLYARTSTHDSIRISQSMQIGFHRVLDLPVDLPLDQIVTQLNAFRPHVLAGYPSILFELARLKQRGSLEISPVAVFLGSEPFPQLMRDSLRSAFGINPHDHYGTTEAIVMASECPQHHGLHLQDDMHIIEIVDRNLRPVSPGEVGHQVLVTNLFAFTQPIIRYRLTDLLETLGAETPCPCGIPFRRIARVEGRNEDIMRFPAQSPVMGESVEILPGDFHRILGAIPGVELFQIILTDQGLTVFLEETSLALRDPGRVAAALQTGLHQRNAKVPSITVKPMKGIDRSQQASQKFRQIWNRSSELKR